jgi:hypothetical protein
MSGLFVHVAFTGDWWGEEPLQETRHETLGDLFRALAGKDPRYPWEAMGRCTGKVYIDGPDGKPVQVGWVFEARNPEPVNRGDEQPTGLRVAWVTVHTAPDTVTRTPHYAAFK